MNKVIEENKKGKEVKSVVKEETPNLDEVFLADNDESINLVPILSKSEIVQEKKKVKLNIGSILSIIIFLTITIIIVLFSTISKIQVQKAQSELSKQEVEVKQLSSVILSNEEILRRIYLYQDISSNQYSARKIFEYFTQIASNLGDIELDQFDFQSVKSVSFEGKCPSLDDLAKFWYLLSEDDLVSRVSLEQFNKLDSVVKFEFKITMKEGNFSTNLDEKKE
ncbi:MAG TPA: hypothetical protein PKL44_00160 [Candidatus Dojkabacteria bacterium]|nr:hypothetical protein [Candidatus Dojkabacteria bacterium]